MFARILPFLAPLPMLTNAKAVESVAAPLDAGFINSFDARDWAKFFVAFAKRKPEIAPDEETMTTWFASALMRGYAEGLNLTVDRRSGIFKELAADNARLREERERLVDACCELGAQNEHLRDYRDHVEAALV